MSKLGKLKKRGPKNKADEDLEKNVKLILKKFKNLNDPNMTEQEKKTIESFKSKFDCPEKKIQRLRAEINKKASEKTKEVEKEDLNNISPVSSTEKITSSTIRIKSKSSNRSPSSTKSFPNTPSSSNIFGPIIGHHDYP